MKTLLTLSAVIFGFSSISSAQLIKSSDSNEPKRSVDYYEMINLPDLQNVQIVVNLPGPMLTVQPTGDIKFSHASCGVSDFKASVKQVLSNVYIVKVEKEGVDCKGPTKIRDYSVQYSSDAAPDDHVVVLNPQTQSGFKPF